MSRANCERMMKLDRLALVSALAVLAVGAAPFVTGAPAAAAPGPDGSTTRVVARQSDSGILTTSYGWTLSTSGDPVNQQVPVGSSGSVHWTITAARSGTGTTAAAVAGQVCVENDGRADTQGLAITERLGLGLRLLATVVVDVSAKPVLTPGERFCYPYRLALPAAAVEPGAYYWILGVVAIDHATGGGSRPGAITVDAARLPSSPTVVDAAVTVSDSNGHSFGFSDSGSVGYDQPVACPTAAGAQTITLSDTATIDQTGQAATGTATVACMAPTSVSTQLSSASVATGVQVSDQATISGAPAGAGGSISYAVYDNPTCGGTPVADATPTDATVTGGAAPASTPITFDTPGSYYWQAVYSGDPAHHTLGSSNGCGSEALTVTPACTHGTPGCPWADGDELTYTQVSWPDNPVATALATANFDAVYSSTADIFEIGVPGTAGFSIRFGDADDLIAFLPQAGTPGPLTADLGNPSLSSAGFFGGEVAVLKLNVDFADAGLLPGTVNLPFGDLHLCGLTAAPDLDGVTVRQLLAIANTWLGSDTGPDTLAAIDTLLANVDVAFDGGVVTPFAQAHLANGTCP